MEKIRRLDLRGEVCPYTFVKAKLFMEEMEPGEILEVIVDYRPAIKNIPKSMEMEGHKVLHVLPMDENQWKVVLKKAEPRASDGT